MTTSDPSRPNPAPQSRPHRFSDWLQFRLRTLLAAVLVICAALAWWVWYSREERPSAPLPPGGGPWLLSSEREDRVRQQLHGPTHADFFQTSLLDAIQYLGELHGVKVRFDDQAMDDAQLDQHMPVSAKIKGESLESALSSILNKNGLVAIVDGDTVVITTFAAALSQYQVTYVYSLAGLSKKHAASGTIRHLIWQALARRVARQASETAAAKSGDLAPDAAEAKRPALDERTQVSGAVLMFRGTAEEHFEVRKLLADLRGQGSNGSSDAN